MRIECPHPPRHAGRQAAAPVNHDAGGKLNNATVADGVKEQTQGWWEGRQLKAADFKWMKPLGTGQFGKVFKAREKRSGQRHTVAVKVMDKAVLEERDMVAQAQLEIDAHTRCASHANVCNLIAHFEDENKLYVVLQAAHSNLHEKREATRAGRFPEAATAALIKQLAGALKLCHQQGVLHRDVKPENVLLDADGNVLLADFGWAATTPVAYERCGTLDYFSPQMVECEEYGADADWWAVGVLAYELLVGTPPFEKVGEIGDAEQLREATLRRIADIDFAWPPNVPLSRDAKHLVNGLLRHNPADRFNMDDVLRHPWILKHTKQQKQ